MRASRLCLSEGFGRHGPRPGLSAVQTVPASVPSKSLVDGSGKRLGDVCAAPGERRPGVDAEPREDVGESLGLEEGACDLFVSAGAGRWMRVNDRPRRGALSLELSADSRQRPFWPGRPSCGRLHCSSAATARAEVKSRCVV